MFNDTVTLFNLYNETWYPTVLQGVEVQEGDFFVIGDFSSELINENDYVTGYATYMKDTYDGVYNINSIGIYKVIPHIEVNAS